MPAVAAVILAAGASTRFGSMKQLARIGGETMLERVVGAAGAAGLCPILVVIPPGLEAPAGTMPVINARPQDGLSRSLRLGVEAVPTDADAVIILLGDQPTVMSATIRRLLAQARGERPVVATRAEGRIGPPVLLRRQAFHLAAEARGDEGLAPVLARYPELVTHIDLPTHSLDVDTPADLVTLARANSAEGKTA